MLSSESELSSVPCPSKLICRSWSMVESTAPLLALRTHSITSWSMLGNMVLKSSMAWLNSSRRTCYSKKRVKKSGSLVPCSCWNCRETHMRLIRTCREDLLLLSSDPPLLGALEPWLPLLLALRRNRLVIIYGFQTVPLGAPPTLPVTTPL